MQIQIEIKQVHIYYWLMYPLVTTFFIRTNVLAPILQFFERIMTF